MTDLWKYEKELYSQGINFIGGTDEAGRGPLFGPVVAACVVLPKDFVLEGLTDSKKLSAKKRELFYDYIIKNSIAAEVAVVSAKQIDKINIYNASKKAMTMAVNKVNKKIKLQHVLTDAMPLELNIPATPIIKGDAKSISIAAASVIAKVTRDKMLLEIDKKHPEYGFKNHKGYPTKHHLEALEKYGLIEGYRKTYGPIKKILETKNDNK